MVIPVDEALSGTVKALVSTADGTLWLITEQDIAKIVGTTLTVYLTGIAGEIAGIDSIGRVWVVNEDGTRISAWNGQAWTTYGVDAGWTPLTVDYYQYVRGGQSDLQGRIWFATSQDVRVFDGNQWTVYTPQEMGMQPSMYDDLETGFEVTVLRSGMVWVAECDWGGPGPFGGRGIRWLDEGVWRGASSPVASGCAIAIADDSIGQVWVGVDSNLWRYDPASGAWIEFTRLNPQSLRCVTGLSIPWQ
jgi:ligand-binding sensor domain-containing protein